MEAVSFGYAKAVRTYPIKQLIIKYFPLLTGFLAGSEHIYGKSETGTFMAGRRNVYFAIELNNKFKELQA